MLSHGLIQSQRNRVTLELFLIENALVYERPFRFVTITWFNSSTRFKKILDCTSPLSSNWQNTGGDAFRGQEFMKRIIRPFSKASWYIKSI